MDPTDRKLRLLFVHNRYLQSTGGEDTAVEAETALLRQKGHEVRTLLFDNADMEQGTWGKVKAGISAVYNAHSRKLLGQAISEFQPDLIHVHNFFFTASPSVLIEAHGRKIPVAVTLHNFRLVCTNALLLRNNNICELCLHHSFPWYGVKYKCYHNSSTQSAMVGIMSAIHKWIGTWKQKVDTFITPANFIRKKLAHSSLGVPEHKIRVKRNFIYDPGMANPYERKSYYLFVGRLSAEKGVNILLDAWSQKKEEKLIIVGDGPERPELQEKYGGLKNVEFVGKKDRSEVLALMKACRALLFPSIWYEGLPVTIVEAFATGTPVIGSAIGAMQEMIQDEKNGLLFKPADPASLIHAITGLNAYISREDYSLYRNARESYLQLYHPDRCYESVMQIYHELIKQKQGRLQT